jgi:hypothetical protein
MNLQRSDLWSLEEYSEKRASFRKQVIEHKKTRHVELGPHATLYFEDAMTMKYQVQEMLRVEKIFTASEIEEELAAYNPLIPDGSNWKATFMLEYPDVEERRIALNQLGGIEHTVWVRIVGHDKVFAIANEDMERSTDDKAAAVHFLRFELSPEAIGALQKGADIHMGIDHKALNCEVQIAPETRAQLIADLAD